MIPDTENATPWPAFTIVASTPIFTFGCRLIAVIVSSSNSGRSTLCRVVVGAGGLVDDLITVASDTSVAPTVCAGTWRATSEAISEAVGYRTVCTGFDVRISRLLTQRRLSG